MEETIDSVLSQTFEAWELLIVDDGSTDNSWCIFENYIKLDQRIKVIKRDRAPKGANTCRNIGLDRSVGQYILFLDADDILTSNCLAQRVELIKDEQFIVLPIGTFYEVIGDSKSIWTPKKNRNYLGMFLKHELPWHTSSVFWRRDFLILLGGFDESFVRLQDVDLHTRALIVTNSFKVLSLREVQGIDFFYRIGVRSNEGFINHSKMNAQFNQGVVSYVSKYFSMPVIEANRKLLKGAFFTALNQTVTYGYRLSFFSRDESDSRIKNLLNEGASIFLFSQLELFLLQLYLKGFRLGFWKIKGYNFIFKELFILG